MTENRASGNNNAENKIHSEFGDDYEIELSKQQNIVLCIWLELRNYFFSAKWKKIRCLIMQITACNK